jgi:hypothetical protein
MISENIKIIKSYLVRLYRNSYLRRLRSYELNPENVLVLGTIARSGTHYMLILFANYINLMSSDKEEYGNGRVTPETMSNYFPNNWHLNYFGYKRFSMLNPFPEKILKPTELIDIINLSDIVRTHYEFQPSFWKNCNVLHIYRNPLDYSVSLFNYMYINRGDTTTYKNPYDLLLDRIDSYIDIYKSYKDASSSGRYKVMRISYESLVSNPEYYFSQVLLWLGVSSDSNKVKQSVYNASIKNVKKFQEKGGKVNPTAKLKNNKFVNSGLIGQWKNYYTNEQKKRIEHLMLKRNVNLDDFCIE